MEKLRRLLFCGCALLLIAGCLPTPVDDSDKSVEGDVVVSDDGIDGTTGADATGPDKVGGQDVNIGTGTCPHQILYLREENPDGAINPTAVMLLTFKNGVPEGEGQSIKLGKDLLPGNSRLSFPTFSADLPYMAILEERLVGASRILVYDFDFKNRGFDENPKAIFELPLQTTVRGLNWGLVEVGQPLEIRDFVVISTSETQGLITFDIEKPKDGPVFTLPGFKDGELGETWSHFAFPPKSGTHYVYVASSPNFGEHFYQRKSDHSDKQRLLPEGDGPRWLFRDPKIAPEPPFESQPRILVVVRPGHDAIKDELWIVKGPGKHEKMHEAYYISAPSWSPDGTKIVFARKESENSKSKIVIITDTALAEHNEFVTLTLRDNVNDDSPTWLPCPPEF